MLSDFVSQFFVEYPTLMITLVSLEPLLSLIVMPFDTVIGVYLSKVFVVKTFSSVTSIMT